MRMEVDELLAPSTINYKLGIKRSLETGFASHLTSGSYHLFDLKS
jgi:hypothetical protein